MTAEPVRVDPPFRGDELATLRGFLDYHRATLTIKGEGLTPAQLATRAVPPSELSLLGIVRHLAEVERSWFQNRVALRKLAPIYYSDADPDGDFHVPAPAGDSAAPAHDTAAPGLDSLVQDAVATWSAEVAKTDEILDGVTSLDATFRDERYGDISLRWLLVHMIEEYARHNGHADLLREAIDGRTGE
jgi:hypothetical protein